MRILIVEPERHPRIEEIPHTLEAMQQTVGGYIEITYPWRDPIALVCDEEGLLKQLPFNRIVAPQSAIFGTFFLCGIGEEDLTDLPEELVDKYMRLLYYWIADREGRTFQRLNELYAPTGQVGFLSFERVDGKLILPEAAKVLQMKS